MVLPAKCISCGGTGLRDGRKFIDFGLNVDYYGAVYFCVPCFSAGIEVLGWLSPDESIKYREEYKRLRRLCIKLEDDLVQYRNILGSVEFLATPHSSDFANTVEQFSETLESDPAPESDDEEFDGSDTESGSSDISSPEQNPDSTPLGDDFFKL